MYKIKHSSKHMTPFGGLNFIDDVITRSSLKIFLTNEIGWRDIRATYSNADAVVALLYNCLVYAERISDLEVLRKAPEPPYRQDGWTVRQVVNHCADSHMNAFIRVKLALTENNPTAIAYHQDLWAILPDSKNNSIGAALKIIEGLHERWSVLFNNLTD